TDRMTGRTSDKISDKISDRMSDKMSVKISDKMTDRISDKMTDRMSDKMSINPDNKFNHYDKLKLNDNGGNFRENYQDKYKETNRELIKYVYSTIDISQFRYDLLKFDQQLSKFISGVYFVSPNYSGKNCFLVFTKLKSKYYSFLINRR